MIEYVEIRNKDRVLIGVIDTAQSVIWKADYYSTGAFDIFVSANKETLELLTVGYYVTRPNDRHIGIIEKINITYDVQYGRMIIASGRFAKSLLDRRLIMKLNGSSTAGKISILPTVIRGRVEEAARQLVNDNAINAVHPARNIPFIKLGELKGINKRIVDESGNATDKQTSFGNLLEYTDSLLQEYALGAYMSFDKASKDLLYNVFEGVDRTKGNTAGNTPIIFSQDYDNLLTSDYTYQTDTLKNTALIGGEGEGVNRFCAMVGVNAFGIDRREIWLDMNGQSRTYENGSGEQITYTDTEYFNLLKSAGKQELALLKEIQTFDGGIDLTNCNLVFGRDYYIGDLITVQDTELGLSLNKRILTATEVQDESGYKIDITYGI